MAKSCRLSQPALDALDQMRRSCSAPLNLEGVLWDLELSNRLTVSQILLRWELRRMIPEGRQSLSEEITSLLHNHFQNLPHR